jgi:hypothetical protein
MEFLKNHYEKIVLSVVLLLMATAAVLLVIQVRSVEEELRAFRQVVVETGGQSVERPKTNPYTAILTKAQPPVVDLVQPHKVFNPERWLMDRTNGILISGKDVGVGKLQLLEVQPMQLKLELVVSGSAERQSYLVNITREYAQKTIDQRPTKRSVTLNSTNFLDAPSKQRFIVARAIEGPPDNPTVTLDYQEPGKDLQKITLTKDKPFSAVVEYGVKMFYPVEKIAFPNPLRKDVVWERKDSPLVFAGDTNIIVEITVSNVVVKAVSNDKTTTIPLSGPPPATGTAKP